MFGVSGWIFDVAQTSVAAEWQQHCINCLHSSVLYPMYTSDPWDMMFAMRLRQQWAEGCNLQISHGGSIQKHHMDQILVGTLIWRENSLLPCPLGSSPDLKWHRDIICVLRELCMGKWYRGKSWVPPPPRATSKNQSPTVLEFPRGTCRWHTTARSHGGRMGNEQSNLVHVFCDW